MARETASAKSLRATQNTCEEDINKDTSKGKFDQETKMHSELAALLSQA